MSNITAILGVVVFLFLLGWIVLPYIARRYNPLPQAVNAKIKELAALKTGASTSTGTSDKKNYQPANVHPASIGTKIGATLACPPCPTETETKSTGAGNTPQIAKPFTEQEAKKSGSLEEDESIRSDAASGNLNGKVVIIGGGLTGLITAYQLHKAGIPFDLIESNANLGGRVATVRYPDGDTSEAPLEEYWERSPTVPLLRELGIEMQQDPAHSSLMIDGQIAVGEGDPNPEQYLAAMFPLVSDRVAFAEWNDKMWKLYEDLDKYCLLPHKAPSSEYVEPPPHLAQLMNISFADFMRSQTVGDGGAFTPNGVRYNRPLPRRIQEWVRITLEPEIAIEWDQIPALDGIEEIRIFLNNKDGFGENNYHLKKGNTEFIKQLVSRLPPHSIHLNCSVAGITSAEIPVQGTNKGPVKMSKVTCIQNSPSDVRQIINISATHVVITVPLTEIHHIRIHPLLDQQKMKALETARTGSYSKIHFRLHPDAKKLWQDKYGDKLFTLLTDDLIGSIYDATKEPASDDDDRIIEIHTSQGKIGELSPPSPFSAASYARVAGGGLHKVRRELAGAGVGANALHLTVLLHGKYAKNVQTLMDAQTESLVTKKLEYLFPGVTQHIQEVEIFSFPRAVAYWPVAEGRSRFDRLAHHLRKPTEHGVYIGGDMTYGSHSEGAALSAMAISNEIKKLWRK